MRRLRKQREEEIQAEIRRRVIKRANDLEFQEELDYLKEANIDALSDVVDIPRDDASLPEILQSFFAL